MTRSFPGQRCFLSLKTFLHIDFFHWKGIKVLDYSQVWWCKVAEYMLRNREMFSFTEIYEEINSISYHILSYLIKIIMKSLKQIKHIYKIVGLKGISSRWLPLFHSPSKWIDSGCWRKSSFRNRGLWSGLNKWSCFSCNDRLEQGFSNFFGCDPNK